MLTPVWRLSGLTGSEPGHLRLNGGRLVYTPADASKKGFDIPLSEVRDINFPWHYINGGFKMNIGADLYRFSFIEPHNENADISTGRETGKAWKKLLLAK
jgi:hypothetical protein